jgi:hypothetical protein
MEDFVMRMLTKKSVKMFVLWAAVLLMSAACGVTGGGGGGTGQERKIEGIYKADSGKTIVFEIAGGFQYYFNAENFQNKQVTLNSTYTVIGSEILFKKDDGTDFESRGVLAEGDASFTWAEHAGETFKKSTE